MKCVRNFSSLLSLLFLLLSSPLQAQQNAQTIIFSESGFPSADTAPIAPSQIQQSLRDARLVSANDLATALSDAQTRLLILPYGSAFPESSWSAIADYLHNGGNLLVLGGRPFTRSAYRDSSGWHLRNYSVRFARQLMIDQYQSTPASDGLKFISNPDIPLNLPPISWKQAFSPVIRLSAVDLYNRGGSAGAIDARFDPLAYATQNGRRLSAPVLQIDHLRNGFNGGRWIFVNAELDSSTVSNADFSKIVSILSTQALRGAESFTANPSLPLYLAGEPIELHLVAQSPRSKSQLTAKIAHYSADNPSDRTEVTVNLDSPGPVLLPAPANKGFHIIETHFLEGTTLRAIYRSGYWIRDEAFLRSGPKLTVNRDFFELDGKPLAVVGTTYMSSESQRLFFEHPNAYVWDADLAQIRNAGLNMIRTGWWTGWDKFFDETGAPYDRALRTVEALLMTARRNNLPIQFNFFAFLPDSVGGQNAYLDPESIRRQQTLISTVVSRFHDVPYLAWDLVNEPSYSKRLWTLRPNEDEFELAAWNAWLSKRYPDRAALAAAWNLPVASVEGTVPLPTELEFAPRGVYVGKNSLKFFDFALFTQETFANWASTMRSTIRAAGSQQLVTVGQDEGGFNDRPNPAFYSPAVDFTTNHSWWQNDAILWDSLVAKQPGQAMLIQETGLQRELELDEVARLSMPQEGNLFERKFALSFAQGSGAIEWLWNTNSYMTEGNETPIGAVRTDGTEKPEATVLRDLAAFAKPLSEHLRNPVQPQIAIVTSQAAQFSVIADLQIAAQRNSVRALAYSSRLIPYVVAENQIAKLGTPKLVIVPSPQALQESTWQALLNYTNSGGTLLVTGPVERDEHWQLISRAANLKLDATLAPLNYHTAAIQIGDKSVSLTYGLPQQSWLSALRFANGKTLQESPYGKGKILWSTYPVELSDTLDASAELYRYAAQRAGVAAQFDLAAPLDSGILIYPTIFDDSVLYIFESESANDASISLRDKLTGALLNIKLPAGRASLILLEKSTKSIVARYN